MKRYTVALAAIAVISSSAVSFAMSFSPIHIPGVSLFENVYFFSSSTPRYLLNKDAKLSPAERTAFRNVVQITSSEPSRIGTGIVVGKKCDWVMTAAHVVIGDGVLVPRAYVTFNELVGEREKIWLEEEDGAVFVKLGVRFSPTVPKQEMLEGSSVDFALLKMTSPAFQGQECNPIDIELAVHERGELSPVGFSPDYKMAIAALQYDTWDFQFAYCNRYDGPMQDNPILYNGLTVAPHLKNTLLHDCPTSSGASGSPVFMKRPDGKVSLIGITGGGHAWHPDENRAHFLDNGTADFPVALPTVQSPSIAFNFSAPMWGKMEEWLLEIHPPEKLHRVK